MGTAWESTDLCFGHYYVTYDGLDLGLIEGPVRELFTMSAIPVMDDAHGGSEIDGIYRGGNLIIEITLKEWNTNTKKALFPWKRDGAMGLSGVIGDSLWNMSKTLVLTALTGTPAASVGPTSRTYAKAIVDRDQAVEVLFGNVERNVPIRFRIFPERADGAYEEELKWYTDVDPV